MTLNRATAVLSIHVHGGATVEMTRVDVDAVPFVNLHSEGDTAAIVSWVKVMNLQPML